MNGNDILEIEFDLTETGPDERDFTDPYMLAKDVNAREFANKIRVENILSYLPRKIIIRDKVYTLGLTVLEEYCILNYFSIIDEVIDGKAIYPEEKVLRPESPWKFYREYTAYVIIHLSKLLAQINAVEVGDDMTFLGNEKMVKTYDRLSEFLVEDITDYGERLERIKEIELEKNKDHVWEE